ncbi:alpha/beta hydrolase, partial [Sphingomonas sp.]|uniref:alpha/beta hydrolase n=1 Tax=Sphingomonas sp. TaxID=28214 RepID=UPI0031E03E35
MIEERITHPDGTGINLHSWPASGTARAAMVLQHGFNAHGAHLAWAAEQFAAAGFACYAVDLRGRGKSGGERFFGGDFVKYLSDL